MVGKSYLYLFIFYPNNKWGNKVLYKGSERELEVNLEMNFKTGIIIKYLNGDTGQQRGGDKRTYTAKGVPVTASHYLPHWALRKNSLSKETNHLLSRMWQNR